ncbi:MAG: hypothetical protein QM778_23445 [Myxococcales bacterium]
MDWSKPPAHDATGADAGDHGHVLDSGSMHPANTDGGPTDDGGDPLTVDPDGGAAPDPALFILAVVGDGCDGEPELSRSCDGHASRQPLICQGGTWQPAEMCPEEQRCDARRGTSQGSCVDVPKLCLGRNPGPVCDGLSRAGCGIDLVTVEVASCPEHAHCESAKGSSCFCDAGYMNDGQGVCINPDDCPANACEHGTCVDQVGDYACDCPDGYTGTGTHACTPVVYCPEDACAPGGVCVDQANWYCQCGNGYDGTGTQACANHNDCPAASCLPPGGTCVDGINNYSCNCAPGFSGQDCVNDVCNPNPCKNGGTCSRTGNRCACAPGYAGSDCTACDTGYALNGSGACARQYTVTITLQGDGQGGVSFNNGLAACDVSCVRKVFSGTSLTVTGQAKPYSKVASWSRAGCTGNSCSFTVTSDVSLTANINFAHNLAFVASTEVPAGGITAADNECKRLAGVAGLHPTQWIAYLGTEAPCPGQASGSCHPTQRMGSSRGWVNLQGEPIADTQADLKNRRWLHPVYYNDTDWHTTVAITGCAGGEVKAGSTCVDWTSSSGNATWGSPESVGDSAEYVFTHPCNDPWPYYCFSIGENAALPAIAAPTGRLAFTTTTLWTAGGGLAAADKICQNEACSAGLTGSANCASNPGTSRIFKAFLATSTNTAASRFSATGSNYYRTDGVLWMEAAQLGTVTADNQLVLKTGLNIGAAKQWLADSMPWVGTATDNCNNWTTATSAFNGEHGTATYKSTYVFKDGAGSCDPAWAMPLFCLQQ